MHNTGPIQVDGVVLPTPTSYSYDIEDLSTEETGRTLDGVMHKDVVAVKDYYTCEWKHLSWEEAATILNVVDGKTQVMAMLIDPRKPGRYIGGQFYVGKRSGVLNNLKNQTSMWSVSLQFIRI